MIKRKPRRLSSKYSPITTKSKPKRENWWKSSITYCNSSL